MDIRGGAHDTTGMDISSLSTSMSQDNVFGQVGAAVARKGLDEQKIEGQNVLQLIDSSKPAISDNMLGNKVDTYA
jgi:hypothetical protein